MAETKRQLSITEAAQKLGISYYTVMERIRKGRLRAVKVGHTYIIQAADVAKFRRLRPGHKWGERSQAGTTTPLPP